MVALNGKCARATHVPSDFHGLHFFFTSGGMVSLDAGYSWNMFGPTLPFGLKLTGIVAAAPNTILVSASVEYLSQNSISSTSNKVGVWRSTDNGVTWCVIMTIYLHILAQTEHSKSMFCK